MIRDCPRCGGPLEEDMGPRDDIDDVYGVQVDRLAVCRVCGWSEYITAEPLPEREWRRRVAAFIATRGLGHEERVRVLREQYGLEFGSRPC